MATHFARKSPITQHWDPSALIPLIADLGVGWIRDEILWNEVEVKKGVYLIPPKTQEWVDLANAKGLRIVVCFGGANSNYEDAWDPEAYAQAAAYVASTLKGKIHAIEIVNEPFAYYAKYYGQGVLAGGNWYGLEKDGSVCPWVWKYVTLLNTAADAIKKANPGIKVIGLGSPAPVSYRQIAKGLSANVDGITDHPYSFRTVPEIVPFAATGASNKRDGFSVADKDGTFASYIESFRAYSKQHKGPREIWLTEWGFTTFREGAKKAPLYSAFSETAQAKYSLRRFMEGLALGLDLSIQYSFMDDADKNGSDPFEAEHHFGLIRSDRTLKPAYAAVQRLARETVGFTPDNSVKVDIRPYSDRSEDNPVRWDGGYLPAPKRIMSYGFRDAQKRPVIALWSPERIGDLNPRAADIMIAVDPKRFEVTILDLYSGEVTTPATQEKEGKLLLDRLPVPDHPLLLKLNPKS